MTTTTQTSSPEISVVVPLYNEESSVNELHERLTKVLSGLQRSYEIIFIDDGSTDKTKELVLALVEKDPHLIFIELMGNYGQTPGLAAGFDYAEGEVIIGMDGDLQHFPEDIPKLLEKIDEGYDIASGWRKKRVDNYLLRRFPSMIANKLMALVSGVELHDFGTTFKAYRKNIIKNVELFGELHRFIPALASRQRPKIAEVPIQNIVRPEGQSNYGLSRTFRVILDILAVFFIVKYFYKPFQFFGKIAMVLFSVGFLLALIITLKFLFYNIVILDHIGMLLFSMLLMFLGVQIGVLGLSLEFNTRIYHKIDNLKHKEYSVRRIVKHVPSTETKEK